MFFALHGDMSALLVHPCSLALLPMHHSTFFSVKIPLGEEQFGAAYQNLVSFRKLRPPVDSHHVQQSAGLAPFSALFANLGAHKP